MVFTIGKRRRGRFVSCWTALFVDRVRAERDAIENRINIFFSVGERQGCGGVVNLTETSQVQLRAPDAAVSPGDGGGELDCQWTVLSPPGKVIRLQFTQLDMTDSGCNDDFIEVKFLIFKKLEKKKERKKCFPI